MRACDDEDDRRLVALVNGADRLGGQQVKLPDTLSPSSEIPLNVPFLRPIRCSQVL
jgi:hypothetical protein